MAVAAVTRAVAGRCGENAADKGADSGWMRLDEDAAATGGQWARREEVFVGCAFGRRTMRCRAEGLFASTVVPEGIPPKAALARRTLWLVKRSSVVVLFPERPTDGQWGPGSRHVFRSALYHLKPVFVAASRPPAAPAYCRVAAADLFATVAGYWVVPHTFCDGFCDDEY